MDIGQTVAQVFVAALAVIGFYGILHTIVETALRPRQMTTAVVVQTVKDAEDLDILLCEASRAACRGAKSRLFLIISSDLMDGRVGEAGKLKEEYAVLVERYGATICFLESIEIPESEKEE